MVLASVLQACVLPPIKPLELFQVVAATPSVTPSYYPYLITLSCAVVATCVLPAENAGFQMGERVNRVDRRGGASNVGNTIEKTAISSTIQVNRMPLLYAMPEF